MKGLPGLGHANLAAYVSIRDFPHNVLLNAKIFSADKANSDWFQPLFSVSIPGSQLLAVRITSARNQLASRIHTWYVAYRVVWQHYARGLTVGTKFDNSSGLPCPPHWTYGGWLPSNGGLKLPFGPLPRRNAVLFLCQRLVVLTVISTCGIFVTQTNCHDTECINKNLHGIVPMQIKALVQKCVAIRNFIQNNLVIFWHATVVCIIYARVIALCRAHFPWFWLV